MTLDGARLVSVGDIPKLGSHLERALPLYEYSKWCQAQVESCLPSVQPSPRQLNKPFEAGQFMRYTLQ